MIQHGFITHVKRHLDEIAALPFIKTNTPTRIAFASAGRPTEIFDPVVYSGDGRFQLCQSAVRNKEEEVDGEVA